MNQYVSDELFHFAGRHESNLEGQFALLLKVLKSGTLLSSRYTQGIDPEDRVVSGELTRVPAICFCDIPRHLLGTHTQKYSQFGLSFTKRFLASKGAKPVIYVPTKSLSTSGRGSRGEEVPMRLKKVVSALRELEQVRTSRGRNLALELAVRNTMYAAAEQWQFLNNEIYLFVKLFDEDLPQNHPKNYYMEREWRVVCNAKRTQVKFSINDVNAVMVSKGFRAVLLKEIPALANRLIKSRG